MKGHLDPARNYQGYSHAPSPDEAHKQASGIIQSFELVIVKKIWIAVIYFVRCASIDLALRGTSCREIFKIEKIAVFGLI